MNKFTDIIRRAISGVLIVGILLFAILYSVETKYIVFTLIALMSLHELVSMFKIMNINLNYYFMLISTLLLLAVDYASSPISVYLLILLPIAIFIITTTKIKDINKSIEAALYYIFSFVYIVIPILLICNLEYRFIITLLTIVWVNDIGAYLVGISIGKHKLCERLSPKKSWEGFFGGLVFASAVGAIMGNFYLQLDIYNWIVISLLTAIAAVYGDLFESMLKRWCSIKDSGKTIPGHGGFMDRFDALFFAIPIYWILIKFLY